MTPLRILTLNTWKCDGAYRARLAWLLTELGSTNANPLRPDVLALQEVFQTNTADTAHTLADALGMQAQIAPARHKIRLFEENSTDSASGLAVLSRFSAARQTVRMLPMDERDGERLAQYVSLIVDEKSVLLINTHLTHLRGASALRQAQLAALLEPLEVPDESGIQFGGQTYQAVFLCGDFNAGAQSPEIQFLLNQTRLSVQNTYTLGNGQLPAVTMPDRRGTEPFPGPIIDFIFSIAPTHQSHPVIREARVVLDRPNASGQYPSDHNGVLIDVRLP